MTSHSPAARIRQAAQEIADLYLQDAEFSNPITQPEAVLPPTVVLDMDSQRMRGVIESVLHVVTEESYEAYSVGGIRREVVDAQHIRSILATLVPSSALDASKKLNDEVAGEDLGRRHARCETIG